MLVFCLIVQALDERGCITNMEHLLYLVLALMYFVPVQLFYGLRGSLADKQKNLSLAGYGQKSPNKCDTNVVKVVSLKPFFYFYRPNKFDKRFDSSERSLLFLM